jgi:ABC-type sugar transport system substrate-binding protein
MPLEDLEDEIRMVVDEDGLKEELAEEVANGDSDEALQRMEDLGIDIDELDL